MAASTSTPVVLSYGMGVDSTAILLRWLADPSSRDFDLSDLVVITAMVGDEFTETGDLVTDFILPRLAAAGVRWVQLARGGLLEEAGIVVLSDSRATTEVHLRGAYKLSDELREAGTIPQFSSGRRLCSVKFKGWVLDRWLAAEFGDRPYRHVMGFNADEQFRVDRDASYSTEQRLSEYPLLEWGWGRVACETYIELAVGTPWAKSCCTFCPFARDNHLGRYVSEPAAAAQAMMIEHRSVALNPRSTLFAGKSVQQLVAGAGLADAVAAFDAELAATEWAVYEVRRVIPARASDPTKKAPAWRSVRVLATGCRDEMGAVLAGHGDVVVDEYGIGRVVLRARGDVLPAVDHEIVVAPAGIAAKERTGFAKAYANGLAALDLAAAVPTAPTAAAAVGQLVLAF